MARLLMQPTIRDGLQKVGSQNLPGTIEDWLGADPDVAAFSDYAGDAHDAKYEVFATYLVHVNTVQSLLSSIEALKDHHGIAGRTVDFKGRKDKKKLAALREYIALFANHPGVCIAVCWDKRHLAFRRRQQERKDLREAIAQRLGVELKVEVAERLMKAIGFLPVVGHGLRDGDRVLWVSDDDAILDGACATQVAPSLQALSTQVIAARLARLEHSTPRDDQDETLLTLPDLVAGTLAASLPSPLPRGQRISSPDPTTNSLLGYLSQLHLATRLLVILVEANPQKETLTPRAVHLAPSEATAWSSQPTEPDWASRTLAKLGTFTHLGGVPGGWRRR